MWHFMRALCTRKRVYISLVFGAALGASNVFHESYIQDRCLAAFWDQRSMKMDSLAYRSLAAQLTGLQDTAEAQLFATKLRNQKQFEAFFLLFVHRFEATNRFLELLEEEHKAKEFMYYMTSRESFANPETVALFRQKRLAEIQAWQAKQDAYHNAAYSMIYHTPGMANPFDN